MRKIRILAWAAWLCVVPDMLLAADLPSAVKTLAKAQLAQVGSGNYRKLGFKIYHAVLWAPHGEWHPSKPYALQLRYARSLSRETLTEVVADGIREQNVADEETFSRWETMLKETLPAVNEDDELIGLSIPNKDSRLFFNGHEIARINEPEFSKAFFGIWFGEKADETLRAKLLGEAG